MFLKRDNLTEVKITTIDEFNLRLESNSFIIGSHICKEWSKFHNNPMFSDISLILGSDKFYGHRIILGSYSFQWIDLLSKSENSGQISLGSSHEEIRYFKCLLEYMYKGTCSLTFKEILPVLELSHAMGVVGLKEDCGELLFKSAQVKNVSYFLDVAQKYECHRLESCCAQYMASEFSELMNHDALLNLPISTWKELLKSDDIKAKSERDLFDAVEKIANLQKDKDKKIYVYNELLPFIRFPFMSAEFLVTKVEILIPVVPVVKELLYEAYRYKVYPQDKSILDKCRARQRRGLLFQWSSSKMSNGITISTSDQLSATHTGTGSTWQSVCGSEYYSVGYHTWDVRVDKNISNWIFIGIVDKSWSGWSDPSSGYAGYSAQSWSYGNANNWGKTNSGRGSAYGCQYTTGDVITVKLDMENKKLSFAYNGADQGVAFDNFSDEVCPVVTLYQPGDKITLESK